MWDLDMDGSVLIHWNGGNGYDDTVIVVVVISEGQVSWGSVVLIFVSLRWCVAWRGGWWGGRLQ